MTTARTLLTHGAAEARDCHDDDGDDDRLDAVQQSLERRRVPVLDVRPRERQHDDERRDDEAHTGDHQAAPSGALVAQVDRQLGRVGSGDEVGGAYQVDEPVVVEPAPPHHDFVAHHRDVRGGSAEANRSQLEEQERQLTKRRAVAGRLLHGRQAIGRT